MVLAALMVVVAIFTIMGKSAMDVQHCPFEIDKWLELAISPKQIMVGLAIDTN
jgi:hypothetical protein